MQESNLEIMNDPYFENFVKRRKLSESTERVYYGRLRAFCYFLGKNPSQLIEDAKNNEQKIDSHFQNYIQNLKSSGKSSSTIINSVDTIKAFYSEYNIDTVNVKLIIAPDTENLTSNKVISEDQIKEALELSNLRDKAIILLHLTSGMEATELRYLNYGDFINSIEEYINLNFEDKFNVNKIANKLFKMDKVIGAWKIEKKRTFKPYVTFNSPESTKAILSYLIDRERKNKPIKSLKDPLFVNSQNQALNVSAHTSIFKRVNERANFGYLTKKRRFFSSTMLRKYFKTKLHESGLDESTISAILGQKLDINRNYHSDFEIKILKNKYMMALGNLSIENANIGTVTNEEYENLLKKLNEKDKELEEIKKYLNYINKPLNKNH